MQSGRRDLPPNEEIDEGPIINKSRQLLLEMCTKQDESFRVLVVDDHTLKIISDCVRNHELMDRNITLVEKLEKSRQPMTELEAIYFISPSNLHLVAKDFENPARQMYAAAHLYLTPGITDQQRMFLRSDTTIPRRCTRVLNIDFYAEESHVFSLNRNDAIQRLFSREVVQESYLDSIAYQLRSFLVMMGEFPCMRYQKDSLADHVSRRAEMYMEQYKQTGSGQQDYTRYAQTHARTPTTLLVLDRRVDPLAPALHDYSYRSLVYDCFRADMRRVAGEYQAQDGKTRKRVILLDEKDALWKRFRHMPFPTVLGTVGNEFDDFRARNRHLQNLRSGSADMTASIKELPAYRKKCKNYEEHLQLADMVLAKTNERKLRDLAMVEQELANSYMTNTAFPRQSYLQMGGLLEDPSVPKRDKIRLLMIYLIVHQGCPEREVRDLTAKAGLAVDEDRAIRNLSCLGVEVQRASSKRPRRTQRRQHVSENRDVFLVMQYIPMLEEILRCHLDGSLDWPYVSEPPRAARAPAPAPAPAKRGGWSSAPMVRNSAASAAPTGNPAEARERILVFVLGGVTSCEMRVCEQLSRETGKEIIIGSTSILTPDTFLDGLESIPSLGMSL